MAVRVRPTSRSAIGQEKLLRCSPSFMTLPSLLDPLGAHLIARVDIEVSRPIGTVVDEPMRLSSRNDDNVARVGFDGFVTHREGDLTFENDEDLGIGVTMEFRTGARRGIGPEKGDGCATEGGAFEAMRGPGIRQFVFSDVMRHTPSYSYQVETYPPLDDGVYHTSGGFSSS
jgi:hypothetical protein